MSMSTGSRQLGVLGQIALTVRDVGRATTFYRDLLQLPLLFEVSGMAFFDCGGVRLMLARGEEGSPEANGSTVLYFRTDDIQATYDQLRDRGVRFVGEPHLIARLPDHELWMAFFGDGEGNLLALMDEVRPVRA